MMMTHVVAVPLGGTGGATAGKELDEVRWVSRAEAQELMGDIAESVHRYLAIR